MVLKFLIDKYVKNEKNKLYCCFVDLRKAFDSVNRSKMFYELLSEYKIGGKFLQILQDIYSENNVFVKMPNGLIESFITQVGVKQGCVLSPILFNLFLNKVPQLFSEVCDPVMVNNECLLARLK